VVADENGLERLTLAAVAKRCGVSLPGLYKHVAGLDAVTRDLSVQAVRELTAAMAMAAAGLSGRDALHAVATAYRSFATAHPGLAAAGVAAPAPDDTEHAEAGLAAVTVLGSVLKGYGIDGADAVDAVRALRATLHGFTSLEAAGGFGLVQSVDTSFTRLIDALDTAFRHWPPTG
jgi:AcrR family transcriptional regulator